MVFREVIAMKLKVTFFIISGLYFMSVVIGLIFGGLNEYGIVIQPCLCILFFVLAVTRKTNKECTRCHDTIRPADRFCGNCGVKI
jgi:hypothetical protein